MEEVLFIVAVNKGETTQRVVKRAGAKARPHTEQFKIVSSQGGGKRPASFEQQKTLNEWNERDGMNSL